MLKNTKQPKVAIQIDREYDEVVYNTEYSIYGKYEVEKVLKGIRKEPEKYKRHEAKKSVLATLPKLTFKEGDLGKTSEGIPIVALVEFRYKGKYKTNHNTWLGFFGKLYLAFLLFGLLTVYMMTNILSVEEERYRVNNTCYVITKNDIAYQVKIRGHIYQLDENGYVPKDKEPFINPWHAERVHDPFTHCKIIELGENR